MNKTKIIIVRHTETIGNVEKRLTGRKDYEITTNGNKLIDKLTKELENIQFDKMYASTSNRAILTIKPVAIKNNIEIICLEDLCEMYFGIYDGWKWEEVNNVQPEIKENQNKVNEISGIPEQESTLTVAERMYNCIIKIAKENLGKTILICSHGVAIEAFLRKIANVPFKYEKEKFCQYNVAINEVDYENDKFYINRLSDIQYLTKE